ncbi:unnamed protein product, partial [marine sediment metagenome]
PRERLKALEKPLLSTCVQTSAAAARAVVVCTSRARCLRFLKKHQEKMTTRALCVFDWHLYAPAYLRKAWEERQKHKEEDA